jgi:hypothetical protein
MTEQQDFIMPSNPADRKKIKDMLHEMQGALQFIDDKRAFMKDTAEALQEQFQIPKKISMKMARTLHKNNYTDVSAETDQFTTLFEVLFQGGSVPAHEYDSDED